MIHSIEISPSAVRGERMVHLVPMPSEEELPTIRACRLAEALRGRYIPSHRGYSMAPSVLARWKALYDAGYDAYRRTGENYGWRVFLHGQTAVTVGRAMRRIRSQQRTPVLIEDEV